MNRTKLTMVIPLVLLAIMVTTPITIIEDAFARYQRHMGGDLSQAASISNPCLNPVSNSNTNNNMISNGNCGGTVSQQGKSGQASTPTTVQNANPNIEVQRATTKAQPPLTSTGGNCTACFANLTAIQISDLEKNLPAVFGPSVTSIEQLCEFLLAHSSDGDATAIFISEVGNILDKLPTPPSEATIDLLENCLASVFLPPER